MLAISLKSAIPFSLKIEKMDFNVEATADTSFWATLQNLVL
jgi:hypothetical protein